MGPKKPAILSGSGLAITLRTRWGDIVFVEMPEVGDTFAKGDEFGTLESVKAVSEAYIPLSGEIIAINEALEDAPELVNNDPYSNWLVEIRPTVAGEFDKLMSRDQYLAFLQG